MADWQDFQSTLTETRVDCRSGALLEPGTIVIASPLEVGQGTAARSTPENWKRFQELGFAWSSSARETIWLGTSDSLKMSQTLLRPRLESYENAVRSNFAAWNGKFPEFAQLHDSAASTGLLRFFKFGDKKLDKAAEVTDKLRLHFRDFLLRSSGMPAILCDSFRENSLRNEPSRQFLQNFESLQSLLTWRFSTRNENLRAYAVLAICTPISFDPPQTPQDTAQVHVRPASAALASSLVSSFWTGIRNFDGTGSKDSLYASLVSLNDWEPEVRGWVNDHSWVMLAAPDGKDSDGKDSADRPGWRCLCPQSFTRNVTLQNFLDMLQPTNFHAEVYRVREKILHLLHDPAFRGDVRDVDVSRSLRMPLATVTDAFRYLNGTDSLEVYTVADGGTEHLAIR